MLSAAWSLHLAERQPADQERTDSLSHLHAAVEAICDIGAGPGHDGPRRWERITDRFGVWDEMRDHYGPRELSDAKQLTRDLRNITQHGSDDVLVNLGYPAEAIRPLSKQRSATGEDLAIARAVTAHGVLHEAVRTVVKRLAEDGIENGWDDDRFRRLYDAD